MNTELKQKPWHIGANPYVGFLYKKCKLIRPSTISKMQYVPEFIEAIKALEGTEVEINDNIVYNTLKDVMSRMVLEGRSYHNASGVMNRISKEVIGDPSAWKNS